MASIIDVVEIPETSHATEPPAKMVRQDRSSRQTVNSVRLSTLMAAYNFHFEQYSNGRKQAVKQIIPGKVWRLVYADYQAAYPHCELDQETLKARVRETIEALDTGNSNEKRGPATLQSEELLKQIKATNAHASRNIIALRQDLVQSNTSVDSFTTPSSGGDDRARVQPIAKIVPEGAATTKGKLLRSQVESLEKISKDFAESTRNQEAYLSVKTKGARLANLKILLDTGVISKEEFAEEATKIVEIARNC
jgi:hypothetical protein